MPVSMEQFGPVSVDYFVGRRVERVTNAGDAGWIIEFEGGGRLYNYDTKLPAPRTITGAALTTVILGLHKGEQDRTPLTELRFGLESVKLNPLEYAISDPNHTRGEVVLAQRS